MKKGRNRRPPKKMKPVFLVFCEGETEEAYVHFLRQQYHFPIKVPKPIGTSISQGYIQRVIQNEKLELGDKIKSFLMFDLDRNDVVKKLEACKGSSNISSNPCVELWFLLHTSEQNAAITTDACVEKLKKSVLDWVNYKKGTLSEKQRRYLWENHSLASERARKLTAGNNPSSMVYLLLEAIEEVKNGSNN